MNATVGGGCVGPAATAALLAGAGPEADPAAALDAGAAEAAVLAAAAGLDAAAVVAAAAAELVGAVEGLAVFFDELHPAARTVATSAVAPILRGRFDIPYALPFI